VTTEKQVSAKELALAAIQSLPDDADLNEIIEEIIVFKTLQERLERVDSEPTYTLGEVEEMMARWPASS